MIKLLLSSNAASPNSRSTTEQFLTIQTCKIRGALLASTHPLTLRQLCTRYELLPEFVYSQVTSLIEKGQIAGELKGMEDRAVYTPALYVKAQRKGIDAFYSTNHYISYAQVERYGISYARLYLNNLYPNAIFLQQAALDESILHNISALYEEAQQTHLFSVVLR